MRFSNYFALVIATLAFQTMCLPTLILPGREMGVGQRDATSMAKLLDVVKNLASITRLTKLTPTSKAAATQKRSPVEEGTIEIGGDPTPISGSEYNKKSTISEPGPEAAVPAEEEKLVRRATTMDPTVGISPDLPSGIVIFMIVFMLYAMITAVSMKDSD